MPKIELLFCGHKLALNWKQPFFWNSPTVAEIISDVKLCKRFRSRLFPWTCLSYTDKTTTAAWKTGHKSSIFMLKLRNNSLCIWRFYPKRLIAHKMEKLTIRCLNFVLSFDKSNTSNRRTIISLCFFIFARRHFGLISCVIQRRLQRSATFLNDCYQEYNT